MELIILRVAFIILVLADIVAYILMKNKVNTLFINYHNQKDLVKFLKDRIDNLENELKVTNSNQTRTRETVAKNSAKIKALNSKVFCEKPISNGSRNVHIVSENDKERRQAQSKSEKLGKGRQETGQG